MPRSMIPFPYSPWPFFDFGQDLDPNGPPPVPYVPGVTIPWSTLPPIAPPPPVVPPTNIPAPQPTVPPSDTPGFDKTFAPQPPPPPVAQAPRNPSLADIIAPWMQPPEPEPPPPIFPPSETPGLDKAIARMNAPTPGFHLTPGLGGFTQPPMWSLPPPPQLLSMPPPLPVPSGGGLNTLGSTLPPMAPAPSPLILANSGSAAPTMPQPGAGLGIPETLTQMARRLAPYATEMGAAIGRTLPSVGAAGAGAFAAAPILLAPSNTGATTLDLGDGLRASMPPGQRYVPIERRVAPGVFGSDVGATWKQVPGLYGEVDPGRGVLVDPEQLREALGDEAANRILNTPGILPMAKPSDEQPPPPSGHNQVDKQPSLPPHSEPPQEPPPPPPLSLLPPLAAITGVLSGTPAKIRPQDDDETVRGLTRENESARFLANKGYSVEQKPKVPGNKNPDYRINGEIYDSYAPAKDTSVRNVAGRIQNKVTSGQTERVVVNLADSSVTPEQLLSQLTIHPIPGLKGIIAISPKSGAIMHWSFP